MLAGLYCRARRQRSRRSDARRLQQCASPCGAFAASPCCVQPLVGWPGFLSPIQVNRLTGCAKPLCQPRDQRFKGRHALAQGYQFCRFVVVWVVGGHRGLLREINRHCCLPSSHNTSNQSKRGYVAISIKPLAENARGKLVYFHTKIASWVETSERLSGD